MKFAKGVVKYRAAILITAFVLLIPALYLMVHTRVNYDMLTYLPSDMDTVIGQDELKKEFGKGAFSFVIVEGMSTEDVVQLKEKFQEVEHVDTVLWYDSILDPSIPMELLPDRLYDAFNKDDSTMMAVFFDTGTSEDETLNAVTKIRSIANENCFLSGMSAMIVDLRDLCEKEEPVYVILAVILALVVMIIFLDNWVIPFIFLISIGMMIVLNLGTNFMLGQISYITKALSAVLQLAVTMDYSIFLWHCYGDMKKSFPDRKEAMAHAIKETLTSVVGSSVTTIAGFIALCSMSFTLGADIGIVMAKGVVLGVLGSVTILPSLILVLDRMLQRTSHKPLIPDMHRLAGGIVKVFPVFLIIFVLLIPPALYGYTKTNDEVYYDLAQCLPEDINFVISNRKLQDDYHIASTLMILTDADMTEADARSMSKELETVDGVKYVIGLESLLGDDIPEEILPDRLVDTLKSENLELMILNSEYYAGSEEENQQIDVLTRIVKSYDEKGMVIGEAPCMKDMIEITGHDFTVVNIISLIAIFLIIFLVERSLVLPLILIAVIELGIFINLGLPHYLGQTLPFIAPICISTIQLGATVDYAILMTTIYKNKRIAGMAKKEAVKDAAALSIPSIIVSGLGLFAATFGVALYSKIDIIDSICMLLSRGAIISILMVVFLLPPMLLLFDRPICWTTLGMHGICKKEKEKR
mgnify:CR=1 FL=1